MKTKHITILSLGFLLTLSSCTSYKNAFSGKWYSSLYGCRSTVTFMEDGKMKIESEANSASCMTTGYTAIPRDGHYDFDLLMGDGMDNQGIAVIENNGKRMKIGIAFGPKEYVQRPKRCEDAQKTAGGMMLDLYRKESQIHSVLDKKVNAPAEAALAFERNRRLGRGINLNGYVDANPVDGNDAPMTPEDFRSIREAGFQSVRIPITWIKHASKKAPYTIDKDFFDKIDWTIKECIKNGLAVSIDQHYYPYINMGENDSDLTWDENIERLKSFWKQISEHYKDYSNETLFFDLLNEPNPQFGAEALNKLYAELIPIIRRTNPGRTLLVCTPNLGQTWTLGELSLPADEWNIIVEGHYYLPHTFTHQNLDYVPSAMSGKQVGWMGTEAEMEPILHDLDFCKHYSEQTGRPVNIGEYGVCLKADQESINRYVSFMQKEFEKRGFSNHIWAYRGLFGLYDLKTKEWNKETLKAIQQQ